MGRLFPRVCVVSSQVLAGPQKRGLGSVPFFPVKPTPMEEGGEHGL